MTPETAVAVATWLSFWSALVPLGWLIANRLDVAAPYWIVGIAWVTAVGSDAQALLDGGTWLNTYLWPALSFSLLVLAVVRQTIVAWGVAGALWFLAWVGMQGQMTGPDIWVPLVGSAVVSWNVWRGPGPLRGSLLTYCAGGTLLYIGYAMTTAHYWTATSFWFAYKAATLLAFALFIRSAHREAARA